MRKSVACGLVLILLLFCLPSCGVQQERSEGELTVNTAHTMPFVAHDTRFYHKAGAAGNEYNPIFLKGINIGQTLPDTPLANPTLSYDVYEEWLRLICEMNINTVKVFTLMDAYFYQALADHNSAHPEAPLYLMQGIWVNGGDTSMLKHAFDDKGSLSAAYIETVKKIVDALHGGYSFGNDAAFCYTADVSGYVAGYIIGSEWDPAFVQATNEQAAHRADFSGKYLYTKNAQPFEIFLCEIGDALFAHETEEYGAQHPVAFLNWAPTDALHHPDEPWGSDDMVSIDTERIYPQEACAAGLFAAVDVYPYYPEFMNVQRSYIAGENGKANSFAAYLQDLQTQYTVPMVVAEFGLSTARGRAHESVMGYHQGMLDETQQGEYVLSMMQDIRRLDLAGGFIFIWQDEWFKRTWNIASNNLAGARYRNMQSAEQHYGIAAYEPGTEGPACWPDGLAEEWAGVAATTETDGLTVAVKQDEAYLYLLVKAQNRQTLAGQRLAIALGATGGRGNTSGPEYGLAFEQPADFLLVMEGDGPARLLSAANSDLFYYMCTYQWGHTPPMPEYEQPDSGLFNPIQMLLAGPMQVPYEQEERPYAAYEAGLLRPGNCNPGANQYNSLADYCYGEDFVEIRLPWYLLNIFDPAARLRAADFYAGEEGGISLEPIDSIQIGASRYGDGDSYIEMRPYMLRGYEQASYHLRLKSSYWILQEGLAAL